VINQPSGVVRIRLATKEAPRLSMSFINLVERGYFNGRPWTDFSPVVRQLGDSIPLFSVPHEYSPKLMFDVGGRLCASNTTDDKNGRAKPNRIFITVKEQDRWNLVYCVFGVVVEGLEVMRNMSEGETVTDIRIEGDSSALRKRFAKELVDWDAAIDAANVGSVR
jgi:cyclophilin family peptidyl-prolyl cis-trans isomerase